MMNKSKLLININNLNEISEYKKIGITNFLFAIKDFSIGYNTFTLNEIPDNSYILINRVMDTKTIEELKTIKDELKRFKGIFFEDLGVYNILRDLGVELIWFQNHFTINKESVNFWLNKVDSVLLGNEITSGEIEELADIEEVIFAILDAKRQTKNNLEEIRKAKVLKRGAFTKKIFLEREDLFKI